MSTEATDDNFRNAYASEKSDQWADRFTLGGDGQWILRENRDEED